MLECYQNNTLKLTNTAELKYCFADGKVKLNDLPQEFISDMSP